MLIIFAVVIIYYNALFPHKININVCLCVFPQCVGNANSAYVRRELHLSSLSGQMEAGGSSTTWSGGPWVTPEHGVLKARDRRREGAQLWQLLAERSLWSPSPNEYGGAFTQPGMRALFLSTTPLLSYQVSLLLLLFPLC